MKKEKKVLPEVTFSEKPIPLETMMKLAVNTKPKERKRLSPKEVLNQLNMTGMLYYKDPT